MNWFYTVVIKLIDHCCHSNFEKKIRCFLFARVGQWPGQALFSPRIKIHNNEQTRGEIESLQIIADTIRLEDQFSEYSTMMP